ncbi:MAG: ABC transporter permease subunit [Clostridiales bacterium]|jgi:putative aldouronate transport system permease protein|nr:ABC transporter permease subunit [Clostridiales bacterium]
MSQPIASRPKASSKLELIKRDFRVNKGIYLILAPVLLYFIIFNYLPMFGIVIAFQDFVPRKGVFGSDWVGLSNFLDFFKSVFFGRLLRNTFLMSFYDLLWGFPMPIILALLLNEIKNGLFKRSVQTLSYMPYFISTVVIAKMISDFTQSNGAITDLLVFFGGNRVNMLGESNFFRSIFVGSNIWQGIGFGSIIYLAALSGVDQELYEAAVLDGANRWKQTVHITMPGIAPTIIIMLILRIGTLLYVGFDKIILLYGPSTYETADVISSFVFRKGLIEANYGYSAAVGLFNSVVNLALLITANKISRRYSETSLF